MQDEEYTEAIKETLADKIIEATKESPKPGRDYGRGRPRAGIGAPQKAVILKRLELNNWNYEKTAREMAMTRRALKYLVDKNGWSAHNDVGLLAEKAGEVVLKHMEDFLNLADAARVEAVNRIRDLIPHEKNVRVLLGIIEELTKYINPDQVGQPGQNGTNAPGGILRDITAQLTQINITNENHKKDGKKEYFADGNK